LDVHLANSITLLVLLRATDSAWPGPTIGMLLLLLAGAVVLLLQRGNSAAGHQVLESQSALDALELARHHSSPIDILLTDVVMPELRGPQLARQIRDLHPNIHVIYMSGYAEGGMDQEIPPEAAFLQKPFRFATLTEQLKLVPRKA